MSRPSRGVNLCCALRDQPVDAFKAPVAARVGPAAFSRVRHCDEPPSRATAILAKKRFQRPQADLRARRRVDQALRAAISGRQKPIG